MVGFHNQTLYTLEDNPHCLKCLNAEMFFGMATFNAGGFICPPHAIPTQEKCNEFVEADKKLVSRRKLAIRFMTGGFPSE